LAILALLTVMISILGRLWNYWMGNMDTKDWRLLKYDAVSLPEYLPVPQRNIKLSSSGSSSTIRRTQDCLTPRMRALWSAPTFPVTLCHISEGVSLWQKLLWEAQISQNECCLLQSLQVVMTLRFPQEIEMPLSNQNITVFCQNMMSNCICLEPAFSLMVSLVSCQLLCVVSMWLLTHMTPKIAHNLYKITNHPCTWNHLHISLIIAIL
jgi:hypothetical protein